MRINQAVDDHTTTGSLTLTLELSLDGKNVLGEWFAGGSRTLQDGPPAVLDSFLQKIDELLATDASAPSHE